MSKDKQGRICASKVAYIEKQPTGLQHAMAPAAAFIFVILFFATLSVLTFSLQLIPIFIIALYAVSSVITFVTYALDKSAAKKGHWRTSEVTLHSMSFFGGLSLPPTSNQ